MRNFLAALALLAFSLPAWAALSVVDITSSSLGSPPPSYTPTNAAAVGNVIAVDVYLYSGASNSATVTDTLNGSYTALGSPIDDIGNGFWEQWFYVVVKTAGTPTVSVILGTNENGRLVYHRITGFTGTPAIDSGMTANYTASATTTVSIASPNTAHNNEAVLLGWKTTSSLTSTPSGWTAGGGYSYYLTAPSAGTSTAFNGTLSASSFYDAAVIGIYDSGALPSGSQSALSFLGVGP